MSEWQPIETAPKDAEVLIAEIVRGFYVVGEARYHHDAECWLWAGTDPSDHWAEPLYPTHWMPLPEPPK